MRVSASAIWPECAPFLKTLFMDCTDWTACLQSCRPSSFKTKRDFTEILRTKLRVLNTIDSKVLMNKLGVIESNLVIL